MTNKYDKTELLYSPVTGKIFMAAPLKNYKMSDVRKDVTDMAMTTVATKLLYELDDLPKDERIVGREYTDNDFALIGMSLETLEKLKKLLNEADD